MTAPPGDAWEDLGGQLPSEPAPPPPSPTEPPAEGQHRNVCLHCGTAIEHAPSPLLGLAPHPWRHVGTGFRGCMPMSLGLWAEPSA